MALFGQGPVIKIQITRIPDRTAALPKPNDRPSAETWRDMHRRMLTIRRAEERLERDVRAGNTPGQVHISSGQEAIATGLCAHLSDDDQITSTHRGHGHFLAKGGDLRAMFAEIYGKSDGVCGGMGGSMHVADFSKGIVGANGIVAAGLAISAGAAWAAQMSGKGGLAACFFGDGAANQGVLMECMNIGALWKLPLIFVCENNGYSEFSPSDTVTQGVISERAAPFGIPARKIDGNDVAEVWATAAWATDHVRSGHGPAFIEAMTYRHSGHFSAEPLVLDKPYRSEEEEADWKTRDPIAKSAEGLMAAGHASQAEVDAMDAEVTQRVADTADDALTGASPEPDAAFKVMFAQPMEAR